MSSNGPLELTKVVYTYPGGPPAVRDVSLLVPSGKICSLVGPSGCGKSTLLHLIAGFLRPQSGAIMLDGDDISRVPPERRPFNIVFQDLALFPHMTVFENVAFGLRTKGIADKDVRINVEEMLRMVRLTDAEAKRLPERLSGGQRQRVALARALVNRPRLLLLDEVFKSLDGPLRVELMKEVVQLQRKLGTTVVLATHDIAEAFAVSEKLAVLQEGALRQSGLPQDVYDRPMTAFVAGFLGEKLVFKGRVDAVQGEETVVRVRTGRIFRGRTTGGLTVGQAVRCLVAPSRIRLSKEHASDSDRLVGHVASSRPEGDARAYEVLVEGGVADGLVRAIRPIDEATVAIGTAVSLDWDSRVCHCFEDERG